MSEEKKIIYFGSSEYASYILAHLKDSGFCPNIVVTQPPKPAGRGLKVKETPVALFAHSQKIKCFSFPSLGEEAVQKIEEVSAQIIIVVAYGKIIPKAILDTAPLTLAVHPSLLPKYRGAAPINWAIINGEKETGITIFKVNERMDAGDIIVQEKEPIYENDTFLSLNERLKEKGASLLVKVLKMSEKEPLPSIVQDEDKATFAPKIRKEDCRINWYLPAQRIKDLVRGLYPKPAAFCFYQNKVIKVMEAQAQGEDVFSKEEAGKIIELKKDSFSIATAKGALIVKRLKAEGKKEMSVKEYLCGHQIKIGGYLK